MLRKSKRSKHLENARVSKLSKITVEETEQQADISTCNFSNYDSNTDQSFDPESVILEACS